MTPAEVAVIEAAIALARNPSHMAQRFQDVAAAVEALEIARVTEPAERPRPWSEVVTTDEIQSEKTGRWYRVLETTRIRDKVQFRLEGVAVPFTKDAWATVPVRRSAMGAAVDVWAEVMRSGPA